MDKSITEKISQSDQNQILKFCQEIPEDKELNEN